MGPSMPIWKGFAINQVKSSPMMWQNMSFIRLPLDGAMVSVKSLNRHPERDMDAIA
jgi:hypothetical protein